MLVLKRWLTDSGVFTYYDKVGHLLHAALLKLLDHIQVLALYFRCLFNSHLLNRGGQLVSIGLLGLC